DSTSPRTPEFRISFISYFLLTRRPRSTPLFPYTTLFRSEDFPADLLLARVAIGHHAPRRGDQRHPHPGQDGRDPGAADVHAPPGDRKSTRLNSSHVSISYAVFCLKKKNQEKGQCTSD